MDIIIQIAILLVCAVVSVIFRKSEYIFIVPLVGFAVAIFINFLKRKKLSRDVEELTTYLLKVQDRLEMPEISDTYEGDMGILQSEIYKVVAILKQLYSNEHAEKRYLVDMLSDISHQLKTPITAISVMAELLETPGLSEEKRLEYVEKINTQLNKITWLVKNILTLSQLEADVIELKKEEVNLSSFARQIESAFEILAEVKEVELKVSAPKDVTHICDRHWTIEAISNIVKNCIEHTPSGGHVEMKITSDNIATNIIIEDDGEGIEEKHLPHIFERFYKSSGDVSSIGIGLAMAKEIIQKQEGKIEVTSIKDKGTEFRIKLYKR